MQEQNAILVVADMEDNRAVLYEIFQNNFKILKAEDGEQALEVIKKEKECLAAVILDIIPPNAYGIQVLEKLSKGIKEKIPFILIIDNASVLQKEKEYELDAADIIKYPFDPYITRKRIENVIKRYSHKNHLEHMIAEQAEQLEMKNRQLEEMDNRIIDVLNTIVEFHDMKSSIHNQKIKDFTKILLKYVRRCYPEYGLTEVQMEKITRASVMRDIGKIAVPDSILLKSGKLTADEFEVMKLHTVKGCEIIDSISFMNDKEFLQYCYEICRYHHERYDGKGYPDRLKGEDIPISAQVVSIADVYEMLISEQIYKSAYSSEKAFHMIMDGECGAFSPKLLECFKQAKDELEELRQTFM